MRLVVDTGIHYKRWTREEAITYMAGKTGMARSEVVSEIERYIVMPGQACSYKIGQIKLQELRARARALGGPGSASSWRLRWRLSRVRSCSCVSP